MGTRSNREGLTEPPAVSSQAPFARWVSFPFYVYSLSTHLLGAHRGPGPVLSTGNGAN